MSIRFRVGGVSEVVELNRPRVVVAGYTGADAAAVQAHIDELAAIGVPPPETVPAFYPMSADSVTQEPSILVAGERTSGEVEPVLIRSGDRLFLGVGSDHTDRDLERESVQRSKEVCPKPLSDTVIALSGGGLSWGDVRLRSSIDGRAYQDGPMSALRSPLEVLAEWDAGRERADVILFGGTVPLLTGAFVHGRHWEVSLDAGEGGRIVHEYAVEVMRKEQ